MNNRTTSAIIAISAALLLVISATTSDMYTAFAHHNKYKEARQTTTENNQCGQGTLPLDIKCQALNNVVSGRGNAVNVIGIQPAGLDISHHDGGSKVANKDIGRSPNNNGVSHESVGNNSPGVSNSHVSHESVGNNSPGVSNSHPRLASLANPQTVSGVPFEIVLPCCDEQPSS
jgi:hypothetical protein